MPDPHTPENGHGEALPPALTEQLWEMTACASNVAKNVSALSNVYARAMGSHRFGFGPDELEALDWVSEKIKEETADLALQLDELHKFVVKNSRAERAGGAA